MRDRRLQAVEAIVERQDPPASHDARGGETSCVGQRRPDLDKRRRSSILETPWIPGRSATASSEADFHVFAKLSKDGLERGFEPEAFAGCEVGGEDDLLDVLI